MVSFNSYINISLVTTIATLTIGMTLYHFRRSGLFTLSYNYCKRKKNVFVCRTIKDWLECKDVLLQGCSKSKCLGLDCEWVTSGASPQKVALLQLATDSGTCVLLRLSHMNRPFPEELIDVLSDANILKVGVSCCDDAKKLMSDHNILVNGCVDLRYIFQTFSSLYNPQMSALGLKSLAKTVLGTVMKKQWRIQCGNWEADELTPEQINYAVQDAVIAVDIFHEIMKQNILSNSFSKLQWYMFGSPDQVLAENWDVIYERCKPYIDKNFKQKYHQSNSNKNTNGQDSKVAKSPSQTRAFSTRSKPLYQNCQLLAPDGELLCTCSVKKAEWYIDRDRGVLVQENPMIVKLNFEPRGRPTLDGTYYTYDKENVCVICGTSKSLLKKHIVPHEYRRHFPDLLKGHSSHDVVLLCIDCNVRSNLSDNVLRRELAEQCSAPIGTKEDAKFFENPELKKVKSAARALLHSTDKLPRSRIEELNRIVSSYCSTSEPISDDLLQKCSELDISILNKEYISHGEKVVEFMSLPASCGLLNFESKWRQHFIDSMKPQFLPKMWSSSHGHERIKTKVHNMKNSSEREQLHNILGLVNV